MAVTGDRYYRYFFQNGQIRLSRGPRTCFLGLNRTRSTPHTAGDTHTPKHHPRRALPGTYATKEWTQRRSHAAAHRGGSSRDLANTLVVTMTGVTVAVGGGSGGGGEPTDEGDRAGAAGASPGGLGGTCGPHEARERLFGEG